MSEKYLGVYVSIGNSDDKLTQYAWATYVNDVRQVIQQTAYRQHGEWFSGGDSPWQNACWCVEVPLALADVLKERLRDVARSFRQDSISWATAQTEFIKASA